jgi:hypothetical protein
MSRMTDLAWLGEHIAGALGPVDARRLAEWAAYGQACEVALAAGRAVPDVWPPFVSSALASGDRAHSESRPVARECHAARVVDFVHVAEQRDDGPVPDSTWSSPGSVRPSKYHLAA